MNILADESVDKQVVDEIRRGGHRVTYIAESQPAISDDEVLAKANRESALLITADKDFGELVFRQARVNAGVILVRLAGIPASAKAQIVMSAFRKYGRQMPGNFCVISRKSVRIRRSNL